MSETLYIQINRNVEVDKRDITVGDVATLLCKNASVTARVKTIKLVTLPDVPKRRVCFSVMKVIELINKIYPDVEVNNIGESDFIIDYIRQKKKNKWLEWLMVALVAVFVFVGSAYAIMAYNNDVNTIELFEKVYEM
ncbi:MAG: stage V sporulation protein AA, partial [Lachnospira sp.]|nr:stage V sporulation protein AA [Lachnospira sp.]